MTIRGTPYDAIVLGGGPAGSTAARLLVEWGHRVLMVSKASQERSSLAESFPPSCGHLFERLGIADQVESAGFYRCTGNTVWWGAAEGRPEFFDGGKRGYQVQRAEFDALLRRCALNVGVTIEEGTVRTIDTTASPVTVAWQGHGRASARGLWVLDCTGRSGVVSRSHNLRAPMTGSRTFAMVGSWTRDGGWGVSDQSHTLVESYEGGWAWSVPVSPQVRYMAVMIDPRATDLTKGGDVRTAYHEELQKTSIINSLLDGATAAKTPFGCDASMYTSIRACGDRFLLVGDAYSFIDPLSSFGVKKAMASAWLAAVVVHTSLAEPDLMIEAQDFFERREREVFRTYCSRSNAFMQDAAAAHGHAFWDQRGVDGSEASSEPDVAALRSDPDVLSAFRAIRAAPSLRLSLHPKARFEQRVVVEGHRLVRATHVVSEWNQSGVRFLRGVNLPTLAELAPSYDRVPDLFAAYTRQRGPVPLPDFLGALSVLVAKDMLEHRVP